MTHTHENRLRVGFYGTGYVEHRLILQLPFRSVQLVREYDLFNALTFALRKLHRPPTARQIINCLHYDLGLNSAPLIHLVNSISLSRTPCVISYEHHLPRWNMDSALGWKRLADPSCRRIIAMSGWAHRYQEHLLARHPELHELIHPKMCVIPPAQPTIISCYDEKALDPERIRFTFVGGDFFRKGGLEILEVFSQLIAEHIPVHLTIISPLLYGDYASWSTETHLQRARELMARMGTGITHIPELDNPRVLHLLTETHVALLPTYDDSYGFFALEGQAAGCPVITTDGCALPEFNSNEEGWIINVPKNSLNQPLHRTKEDREQLSSCIRENLSRIVREICANPSSIRVKGERALARIRNHHSPEDHVTLIESIYREALA